MPVVSSTRTDAFPPTAPFENRADRFRSFAYLRFEANRFYFTFFSLSRTTIVREKERDRVIDGRDKLDTSSRQNCRAGSRTLELNFERN